ncbi:MAG: tetratricopeptide repeat protein, partial [Kiritimatiellaceae bacterium]|nr:tetratricopeptide repeat protein [Kiritimatiellaceae bacterium]
MMRLFTIFSVVLILTLSGVAQNDSEESSELKIRADTSKGKVQSPTGRKTYFDPSGISGLLEKTEKSEGESASVSNHVKTVKVGLLMNTGAEYTDEGDYEEAERAYLRALEQAPDNDELQFRLSTLYVMMERYGDAISLLNKQLERHPENPHLHNNIAWCYTTSAEFRNTPKALRHAREALLTSPDNHQIWNTLAEAYYVAGNYEQALRSAEHSLDLLSRSS